MATPRDTRVNEGENFLEGKLLIAMPGMTDERFAQTVIYMCAHSSKGAMGIVINKPIPGLSFPELMKQLQIETTTKAGDLPILYGGPVETGRGFVLHTGDYEGSDSTLPVSEHLEGHRGWARTETRAVRARLCRMGRRPGRERVPVQRLASLPRRSRDRVRNRSPGEVEHRAGAARHRAVRSRFGCRTRLGAANARPSGPGTRR
jgi:hypothetical protein